MNFFKEESTKYLTHVEMKSCVPNLSQQTNIKLIKAIFYEILYAGPIHFICLTLSDMHSKQTYISRGGKRQIAHSTV